MSARRSSGRKGWRKRLRLLLLKLRPGAGVLLCPLGQMCAPLGQDGQRMRAAEHMCAPGRRRVENLGTCVAACARTGGESRASQRHCEHRSSEKTSSALAELFVGRAVGVVCRAEEEAEKARQAEQAAQEARRKEEELDAVRKEVARRKAEEKSRLDQLAKSAQVARVHVFYSCMHVCMYIQICTHKYTNSHTYIHTYTCINTHTCILTYSAKWRKPCWQWRRETGTKREARSRRPRRCLLEQACKTAKASPRGKRCLWTRARMPAAKFRSCQKWWGAAGDVRMPRLPWLAPCLWAVCGCTAPPAPRCGKACCGQGVVRGVDVLGCLQVKSVSAQLEAAAGAARRTELENRVHAARRQAEAAMAQQDWTLARTHLDAALEVAQHLEDTNLQEDLERIARIVDQGAQDARQASSDPDVLVERAGRRVAVRAAPPAQQPAAAGAEEASMAPSFVSSPPKAPEQKVSSQGALTSPHERSPIVSQPPVGITPSPPQQRDLDPFSLPPLVGEEDGHIGGLVSPGVIQRPALPAFGADDWQEETEPSQAPGAADGYWGPINPGAQGDGGIMVSTLGHEASSRLPADNIDHWKPPGDQPQLLFDLTAAEDTEPGMEDVTGGLLGGAMYGLASLSDNTRRSSAFLLSVNTSLSQRDLNRILEFGKRAQLHGTYNPEADNGLMVRTHTQTHTHTQPLHTHTHTRTHTHICAHAYTYIPRMHAPTETGEGSSEGLFCLSHTVLANRDSNHICRRCCSAATRGWCMHNATTSSTKTMPPLSMSSKTCGGRAAGTGTLRWRDAFYDAQTGPQTCTRPRLAPCGQSTLMYIE